MRADADFMVYVGARWPALVGEALLLGCPPQLAAEAVTDALARCRRGWGRASREEDVDQLVRGELAAACARRPTSAAGEQERREQALSVVVLSPPTLAELRGHERALQVRTARRAALVLVPLLLVAGGLTWWTTRGQTEEQPKKPGLTEAALTRAENPAGGVTWWAGGELHLDHVVLAVAGLRDVTRLGSGAVYGDDQGRVVYVGDDGARTVLGHKDPDVPVAATDENGWAAWVETSGDRPEIMVRQASSGNVVAKALVDESSRVVAVDGETIFFVDAAGAHALLPGGHPGLLPVSPAALLDVRSRIQVFQVDDDTIQIVQSYFDVEYHVPGRGARLSSDGNVLVTRVGAGDDTKVTLYDTRSGEQLPNDLAEGEEALAVTAGDRGAIAYVVAPHGLEDEGDLQLRTCDLRTSLCQIVARIPDDGSTPVLAR